mmetsp:Transcript_28642/g.93331  ORF Transcript_28642/g.93331 Transcript_28642/m.93331 type:complete len:95 (-) Transcript_28642:76-360(-)
MRAELLGVGTDIASARKVAFSLMPSLLGLVRLLQCGAGAGAEGQEGLGSDLRQDLLTKMRTLFHRGSSETKKNEQVVEGATTGPFVSLLSGSRG